MSAPHSPPRLAVLYHYFHPDDVVSARLFSELARAFAAEGWAVEALPSDRGCRHERVRYPRRECWQGIAITRVRRPPFPQAAAVGRLLNALWMITAWSGLGRRPAARRPHAVIIGTDPPLAVLAAAFLKRGAPPMRVVHACHDLYPEAAVAEGLLAREGAAVRFLEALLRPAYRACDRIVELGPRMRARLARYGVEERCVTIAPWALWEPPAVPEPDPAARRALFGDAALAVLYSGNFGRAHACEDFLRLARAMRGDGAQFRFAVRGNRAGAVAAALAPEDANIRVVPFVAEPKLGPHLAAADVHMVSLRPEWSGIVEPSKFFAALAAGRPVIFAGPPDSLIGECIARHGVGWLLDAGSADRVAAELRALAKDGPRLRELQGRCHALYHAAFSRQRSLAEWKRELARLIAPEAPRPTEGEHG